MAFAELARGDAVKNAHLAAVFDQLEMPGMAHQARSGRDLSLIVVAMNDQRDCDSARIANEATRILSAALLDGYDVERIEQELLGSRIRMPYAAAAS